MPRLAAGKAIGSLPISPAVESALYYDVVEATNDHQYKKTSSGEDWTKLG